MKYLTNMYTCAICGKSGNDLSLTCQSCGSRLLLNAMGGVFEPAFAYTTYKASLYTPPVRCRRLKPRF